MDFLRRNILLAVVFITGACVLILEVVAVRLLSPFFGNTIFTVSSVLSVILAALSLGYYIGGRVADRHPSTRWFFGIILASGLGVLFMQLMTSSLLPLFSALFSLVYGPLVSALFLFFVPSFLLGMLSPYAITLQHARLPTLGIGSISGKVFFWSTLGSIFGSLAAGFYLIPRFGVDHIFIGVGGVLVLVGLAPLPFRGFRRSSFVLLLGIVLFAAIVIGTSLRAYADGILYSRHGVYENLLIFDGEYEGRPARFFQQDHSASAAMFLDSDELVYDYTKYYALYALLTPHARDTLVIGGGGYSVPKVLLKELPEARVVVAEIEPSLLDLGKRYFRVPDDPRLENYAEDGRRLLQQSDATYDFIFGDAYSSILSVPAHLTTREFFSLVYDRLNPEGAIVINISGSLLRTAPSFVLSDMRTLQSVFPRSYFFAARGAHFSDIQNIIFVGHKSDRFIDFTDSDVHPVLDTLDLPNAYIDMDRFELSSYPIFTDRYSPASYFISKVIRAVGRTSLLPSGDEMLALIAQQVRYGPRFSGSSGHAGVRDFLIAEMRALTEAVAVQTWDEVMPDGTTSTLTNVIGRFYPERERRIILGTHYDSRQFADKDPRDPQGVMPGANDSASGVAVLVALAQLLANTDDAPPVGVDIVFFDGEELGNAFPGRAWRPLGSTYFADHLDEAYVKAPEHALILDMVCDKDLAILQEPASVRHAPEYVAKFWDVARRVAPDVFSIDRSVEILDDHTPLNAAGIPSILLIDFEYPRFHTTRDTIDACSGESLEAVLESVRVYLYDL